MLALRTKEGRFPPTKMLAYVTSRFRNVTGAALQGYHEHECMGPILSNRIKTYITRCLSKDFKRVAISITAGFKQFENFRNESLSLVPVW